MKIRYGFISNSSSSSFVIAGVKLPDNFPEDIREALEENWEDELQIEYDDDVILLGFRVLSLHDDEGIVEITNNILLSDEKKKLLEKKLIEVFERAKLPMSEIKLYGGVNPQ